MKTIICTLFEGNYHLGVAVLINSLHKNGYTGNIFVGYRGKLPNWSSDAAPNPQIPWENCLTLKVASNLNVHFLPIETDIHFTNYKPKFILDLWSMYAADKPEIEGIFYFDPDIVNKGPWDFYERWIGYGIAVVHEVVYHDMPHLHPKRCQWMAISNKAGIEVKNRLNSYVNAGFIGVSRAHLPFIEMWKNLIQTGVDHFSFNPTQFGQSIYGSDLLKMGDQDLLNLSLMCTPFPISEYGPEGMDFSNGGWLMSHATGAPKPWNNKYLLQWLKGRKPSIQNKVYWQNAIGIVKCYSPAFVSRKAFFLKMATFLSRFYSK